MAVQRAVDLSDPKQRKRIRITRQVNSGKHDRAGKPIVWEVDSEQTVSISLANQLIASGRAVQIDDIVLEDEGEGDGEGEVEPPTRAARGRGRKTTETNAGGLTQ